MCGSHCGRVPCFCRQCCQSISSTVCSGMSEHLEVLAVCPHVVIPQGGILEVKLKERLANYLCPHDTAECDGTAVIISPRIGSSSRGLRRTTGSFSKRLGAAGARWALKRRHATEKNNGSRYLVPYFSGYTCEKYTCEKQGK